MAGNFTIRGGLLAALLAALSGCAAIPDAVHLPVYHNPFPQLHKVAILPFYNQSQEPTVDGDEIAVAYYNELQAIPGFEVMPVGVAKQLLAASRIEPRGAPEFQKLGRMMGVDVVLVGSITEFSPYYPPRMGLAVDWYASNPGFHAVPAGYGLPWNTPEAEYIPSALVEEAEFALAREQLKTQTPDVPEEPVEREVTTGTVKKVAHGAATQAGVDHSAGTPAGSFAGGAATTQLPADWPDPRGFVPPPPTAVKPPFTPHLAPIISHTRVYHGNDGQFTQRLSNYYYTRDEARFGGWQSYLQRPQDFVRFCCWMHVTETLAARGGAGQSRVVWRWPISRYVP